MNGKTVRGAEEVLEGSVVRLEPLSLSHLPGLVDAATEDRATYGWTSVPSDEAQMRKYVEAAIALREQGLALPYATVRKSDDRVVGSTRFANLERWEWPIGHPFARPFEVPDAVEIGWTWLAATSQRTAVNSEAKLLMLGFAFELWQVHRITLKTDVRNARSRANIERIGGRLDGILRAHMPGSDGSVRDSAWYSIIRSEWPASKAKLEASLGRS